MLWFWARESSEGDVSRDFVRVRGARVWETVKRDRSRLPSYLSVPVYLLGAELLK